MTFETAFIAGYAVVLLLAALGLRRLGRVTTDPWSSRALAAYRASATNPVEPATHEDWPHSEVPRLHSGLGAVACLAASLLCLAELVRSHDAVALAVLMPLALLAAAAAVRLAAETRAARPD
jgi:hypothetical protein